MRTIVLSIIVFISSIAPVDTLSAQSASAASDSVVVKALHDEIYRNLNQLKSDVAGKPCYISYMLSSTNELPEITSPSTGMRSPGRTSRV